MKIARLAGLMLIAIFAMSLVAASAAMAEPEFAQTGATISGTSGAGVLSANNGTEKVECASDVSGGTVTSSTLVGNIVVHFLNCTSTGTGGSKCAVNSTGAASGLILTTTLHGILGLILPKPSSGTGVALLLLPISGKRFVTLASNTCTPETAVTGDVAGEVTPVKSKQTTGKLIFKAVHPGSAKQAIEEFDPSTGGKVKPELVAFTTTASEETEEAVTFSSATEVT